MADTELNLLPCPFCGNESPYVQDSYLHNNGYMVLCGNCTAEGPLCSSEKQASTEWNRRATSPSPSTAPEATIRDSRTVAEVDDEGLPALPPEAARAMKGEAAFFVKWQDAGRELRGALMLFTAEQYRQGQRDAVAADRARRGGQS